MPSDVSFKGVFPILVTPFDDMEVVDLDSFVRVVRFMAEIGVDITRPLAL
jgi:dihydrodipicolinate synthase/N-acetylneuraminate lyase